MESLTITAKENGPNTLRLSLFQRNDKQPKSPPFEHTTSERANGPPHTSLGIAPGPALPFEHTASERANGPLHNSLGHRPRTYAPP